MKTVFTNSQLCHVWAQQKQPHGRGSNMYFEGSVIYSYGPHFPAAAFHTIKGQRIVLINSKNYSVSTAKHLSHIFRAVLDLPGVKIFHVPNVLDFHSEENFLELSNAVIQKIDEGLSKKIVKRVDDKRSFLESLNYSLKILNEFEALDAKKITEIPSIILDAIEENFEKRLAHFLATAGDRAQKAREAQLRKELKEKRELEQFPFFIAHWEKTGQWPSDYSLKPSDARRVLGFDVFFIHGNIVKTSRGAQVSLAEALNALEKIENKTIKEGESVGAFAFQEVSNGLARISCHVFDMGRSKKLLLQHNSNE
jgi:DNA polymerase III delta prime subunit